MIRLLVLAMVIAVVMTVIFMALAAFAGSANRDPHGGSRVGTGSVARLAYVALFLLTGGVCAGLLGGL